MSISIDDLKKVRKLVSHYNCADGTVSAMVCKTAFQLLGTDVEITFDTYNSPTHDKLVPESGIIYVDFTPPYAQWEEFRNNGTIVIDHHASARKHIQGDKVIFGDGTESGAYLCFKHILVPVVNHLRSQESPDDIKDNIILTEWDYFCRHISLYDTWQKGKVNDDVWEEACNLTQGVIFCGEKALLEDATAHKRVDIDLLRMIGKRWNKRAVNKARHVADNADFRQMGSYKVALYNNTEKITTEIGDILGDHSDFSVGYSTFVQEGTHRLLLSFRTRGTFDTTVLSKHFGGGGHAGASGCLINTYSHMAPDLEYWFRAVEKRVTDHEMGTIQLVIDS